MEGTGKMSTWMLWFRSSTVWYSRLSLPQCGGKAPDSGPCSSRQ